METHKKTERLPPPGRRPAQSNRFQRKDSVFDEEILVIERADVYLSIFIVSDGAVGRGCCSRDRDDLADRVRDCGVDRETVSEPVEPCEAVAEAAKFHAGIEAGETGMIHAKAEAAEAVEVHGVAEAAESVAEMVEPTQYL